jgi:GTP cyclohydrolase I
MTKPAELLKRSPEPETATASRESEIATLDAAREIRVADPAVRLTGVEDKLDRLAHHVRGILTTLGLDLEDHNLRDTDRRVARLYLEMFHGLEEGAEPEVTTFPNEEGYSHMVMEKKIPFYSMCSHHLIPFYGHAHIAYIPNDRIIGLSKFARVLEFYAKRPQLQERLTEQVVNYLMEKLEPKGAMVVIEARHLCVEMRGVRKPGALTVTSALRGIFHQRPVREEFLDLLRRE